MLGIHDYWLFVTAGVILNLTPGQDTFYILGRSIAQGSRIGVASALGVCAGCLVHTFAAAVGLSAILATSASAFMVLKVVGAAYLVYLGVRMLMTAGFPAPPPSTARAQSSRVAFGGKASRPVRAAVKRPRRLLASRRRFVRVPRVALGSEQAVMKLRFAESAVVAQS